jgi:7,8-dihydropterin-6-yl-methyl-4-(beta-D-ribofuranosyl)aminobenzene 5'-phosphate synthase
MRAVETVTLTSVTENYVDMLLPDEPGVTRAGLAHHFDPKRTPPIGENGIALHALVEWGDHRYRVLFDTGMTGKVLTHNAAALGVDLDALDHVVISHGHPDHYGGLAGLLEARETPVPISIHADAFLPRYLRLASGEVAPYYNHDLTPGALADAGGRAVTHREPLEIGPGMLATGAIPREVDFEAPPADTDAPNALLHVHGDGRVCGDTVPDDQALVIRVGDGIVVLVGCSHAGVINTLRHAIKISGCENVLGIFGGFHLGFPGTPEAKTTKTIEALRDIEVDVLCPMHCTGMRAMMELQRAFPEGFVLNCTGTTMELGRA